MRVITAVYLHVGPKLRDEWLSGGDVDGVVEEAVPVEQGWRGLVHWWHLRWYRKEVEGTKLAGRVEGGKDDAGEEGGAEMDENDFFKRELEKMGWGGVVEGLVGEDEEEDGEEDTGRSEFEGGMMRGDDF